MPVTRSQSEPMPLFKRTAHADSNPMKALACWARLANRYAGTGRPPGQPRFFPVAYSKRPIYTLAGATSFARLTLFSLP